jgi:hypothetical protein
MTAATSTSRSTLRIQSGGAPGSIGVELRRFQDAESGHHRGNALGQDDDDGLRACSGRLAQYGGDAVGAPVQNVVGDSVLSSDDRWSTRMGDGHSTEARRDRVVDDDRGGFKRGAAWPVGHAARASTTLTTDAVDVTE